MAHRPDTVACPACGEEMPVGLPRGATVEAVAEPGEAELDGAFTDPPRQKRRESACAAGHPFYVYFRF